MNQMSPVTVSANGRNYAWPRVPAIAICLDGCEPAYLDEAIKAGLMPVLERIKAKGTVRTAYSVIPSFTNPNNLSIATGRPAMRNPPMVNAGTMRPPMIDIITNSTPSPSSMPQSADAQSAPSASACVAALATVSIASISTNAPLRRMLRFTIPGATDAANAGRNVRSTIANANAASSPDIHAMIRPASQSPESDASLAPRTGPIAVQFGTAVSRKPANAAVPKPKTISRACH